MKKLLLPLMLSSLMSFTSSDPKLSEDDRKMMLLELKMSYDHMIIETRNLTPAQLNFKADENSWSIAECLEHIVVTEDGFVGLIKGMETAIAEAPVTDETELTDRGVLLALGDRSSKVKTGKPFEPSGQFGSFEETLAAFKEKRKSTMSIVESVDFNLRLGRQQLPFGNVDGVQLVLAIAGHTDRHIRQIEEIKINPNFPKE